MKKLLFLFFFCFSIFADDYSPDIGKILKRKEIVVAIYGQDEVPFFKYGADKTLSGIDVNLANSIAKYFDAKVIFKNYPTFDSVVEAIFKHEADMAISALSFNLKRAQKVLFTDAYASLHVGIIYDRSFSVSSLNREDVMIGFLKDSTYERSANVLFPKAQKLAFGSWKGLVKAVADKDIAASVVDEPILKGFDKVNEDPSIGTKIFPNIKDDICIAVPWDSRQLLFWLNSYLKTSQSPIDMKSLIEDNLDHFGEMVK